MRKNEVQIDGYTALFFRIVDVPYRKRGRRFWVRKEIIKRLKIPQDRGIWKIYEFCGNEFVEVAKLERGKLYSLTDRTGIL